MKSIADPNARRGIRAAPSGRGAEDGTKALAADLRRVLRAGLPVQPAVCGETILALRGVHARSLRPGDPESRAQALDGLLREQLDRLENHRLSRTARLLFGAEAETSGSRWMERRRAAAAASGYEPNHFRKHVEPRILAVLAWQLQRDSEDFGTRHAEPPELTAATGPVRLPADVFAWEAAEHQHAIARLWSCVYGLRAELLTVARLVSMDPGSAEQREAADTALWRYGLLLAAGRDYRSAYGEVMLHATTAMGADDVAQFAGWTPGLTSVEEQALADAADPYGGRKAFLLTVDSLDEELRSRWHRLLTQMKGPRP